MKITVEQEKPVFKPITIQLETAQEYFTLLASNVICGTREVREALKEFGVEQSLSATELTLDDLYLRLKQFEQQVKETL